MGPEKRGEVTESAAGSRKVEVGRGVKLCGQKSCYSRLISATEQCPEHLHGRASRVSNGQGNATSDGRDPSQHENLVDPVPAVHRLAVGDEVRLAADRRAEKGSFWNGVKLRNRTAMLAQEFVAPHIR